ncbi:undecaprenyl-phosphate glucose phosphotransferase [Pluralibacter gergoviae]|nr:undecaprenyl-phosphate glucose phosphotransferase [Pluralibacter gergoviae]
MNAFTHRTRSNTNASIISVIQRFSDILIIFLSLYSVVTLNEAIFGYEALLLSFLVLVIFQMIGGITDFYRSWRGVNISTEIILILKNWSLSILITIGLIALQSSFDVSLNIYIQWYLCVVVGLISCRLLIRCISGILRKFGYNTRRVALAGSLPAGVNLIKSIIDQPWLGFIVEGYYDDNISTNSELKYVGDFGQLFHDAREGKLDRIYVAMNMSDEIKLKKLISKLTDTTCSVFFIPDIFTFNILQSRTEEINGIPVVPLFDTPLNGINMIFKRLEDIIISLAILFFISPVLCVIAVIIKCTSPGPVIFRQIRYGMDGKPIKVWKFRTMVVMENDQKVIQAKKNDSRVTVFGRFLRSTSLDELPQFFNVLFGQMSVVGPRPHAVVHNEQYRSLIQGYMLRHKVKPGITGLAQVNGWRGETDTLEKMQKRIEYDLIYIRGWSIWLDLKIIVLTVFKGFINKSAY